MKKTTFTIAFLLVLAMLFLPVLALAQIILGTPQGVRAPLCVSQEAMVVVAKLDSTDGPQAAMAAVQESPVCDVVQATVLPRRVVFSAPTARGATVRVVEVDVALNNGETVRAFMLADTDVVSGPST